jgi:hypothetical protein
MGLIWTFVRKPSNQRTLAWLGGGVATVVATVVIPVVLHFWPANEAPKAVCAQGGIAAGRDASRNTVNNNGGFPTDGVVTCADTPAKK